MFAVCEFDHDCELCDGLELGLKDFMIKYFIYFIPKPVGMNIPVDPPWFSRPSQRVPFSVLQVPLATHVLAGHPDR